ncbi:hypothetical protein [Anaerobacillus sp. 1_MG-2023]|nr:hypothetical protein [Anaerobacillus sp. 1_MG-2023]MDO6656892.1 hypothetical protein [Anaerobacillus sp. 1_MG-2023]
MEIKRVENNRLSEEVLEEWDTKFVSDNDLLFFGNKPTKFTAVMSFFPL